MYFTFLEIEHVEAYFFLNGQDDWLYHDWMG